MGIALFHGDFAWILGGVVGFVGLMLFLIKIARGQILSVLLSAAVWYFVYKVHGGSNSGIMTATMIALMFDMIGIPILKMFWRR